MYQHFQITAFFNAGKPLNERDFGAKKGLENALEKPPIYAHIQKVLKYLYAVAVRKVKFRNA